MASGQNTTLLPAMSIEQNWSARGSFHATPCSLSQWHWTVSLILGLDLEPLLAVRTDLGERQGGAVHLGGFAQQAQHFGHGLHGVLGFEQQAAGLGRSRQQS